MYLVGALVERYSNYVDAGIAFMDQRDANWWKEDASRPIDTVKLDIRSQEFCLIAQHTGKTYGDAQKELGFSNERCVLLGFDISCGVREEQALEAAYEILTGRWCTIIVERRQAARAAVDQMELPLAA